VPEGGSASLVDEQGRPVQDGTLKSKPSKDEPAEIPASEPVCGKVAERPKPITIAVTPEPWELPAGGPISKMAIVPQAAAVPGLRSRTIETIGHRGACDIAYSPDARILATRSADGAIRLWDADNGNFLHAIVAHDAAITGLTWSPDGTMLASASRDAPVRIWDAATGRRLMVLKGDAEFWSVAWSPTGRFLAAGAARGMLHFWEFASKDGSESSRFATGREGWRPVARGVSTRAGRVADPDTSVESLAWSPDGVTVARESDSQLEIWDAEACQRCKSIDCYVNRKIAWSFDGKMLASGTAGTVRAWPKQTFTLRSENGAVLDRHEAA